MSTGREQYLRSLCFADDVLLTATSSKQISVMLEGLRSAAAASGITIHPEKKKMLTNAGEFKRNVRTELPFDGGTVKMLPYMASAQYLGRQLFFHNRGDKELTHRRSSGWAYLFSHRQELTNKRYPLWHRLRLFSASVGATVLYG